MSGSLDDFPKERAEYLEKRLKELREEERRLTDESFEAIKESMKRWDKLIEATREDVKAMVEEVRACVKNVKKLSEDLAVVNTRLNGFDLQVKGFANNFEEVDGKLREAAESWAAGKGSDEMAGVVAAIEKGFADLIQYKRDFEAKMDARRAKKTPPMPRGGFVENKVLADLMEAGVDLGLLDVNVQPDLVTLKPKQYLDDLWRPVMDAVRSLGFEWIREGKNSRWELREDTEPRQPSSKEDWKPYTSGRPGEWIFSNTNPELANRIMEGGGKLETDEYTYKLSGDPNEQGYPKFIGRWGRKQ